MLRARRKASAHLGLACKSKTHESDASDGGDLSLPYKDLKRTAVRHAALSSSYPRTFTHGCSIWSHIERLSQATLSMPRVKQVH